MRRKTTMPLTIRAITDADVAQYRGWESVMAGAEALSVARQLSEAMSDVRVATVDDCWRQIWTKPLYANNRVPVGESYEKTLTPLMHGAWRTIGLGKEVYFVSHDGNGRKAANFSRTGTLIDRIGDVCGISAPRLLAIQGGANYLRSMVDTHGEAAPLRHLAVDSFHAMDTQLTTLVPAMRVEMGRGWGHISIMHMLTDFGLAVKPDLHLVRTVRHLGLVDGLRSVKVPNLREGLAIITAITRLVQGVYGASATPADLRYADKLLMEASRLKLICMRAV